MKDKDIDQRHAAAYHVAGRAVMAFYLGGWVNDEGAEIDERRYCGLCLPLGHDAQAKERFLLLCDLAGWRAEHLWHGKGSSRDGYPDEELFAVLEDRRQGGDDYDGDDADAVDAMIEMSPAATDDELAQRYTDYSAECYAILREPTVWSAIERVGCQPHGTRQAERSRSSGSYRRRRGETPPVGRRCRRCLRISLTR